MSAQMPGIGRFVQRQPRWTLKSDGTLSRLEGLYRSRGVPALVLSRGLCSFACVTLPKASNVQFALRAAVLTYRQQSPFADAGVYARRVGAEVMLWSWNAASVHAALADQSEAPRTCEIVPETVLHRPYGSGLRLVQTIDGIEAQIWKDDALTGSQWWPAMPPAGEYALFLRSQGLSVDTLPNAAGSPEIEADAIEKNAATRTSLIERFGALPLAGMMALLCLLPSIYLMGQAWSLSQAVEVARSQATDPSLRTGAQAQADAIAIARRLEAIDGLNQFPHPIDVLASVGPILASSATKIVSWDAKERRLSLELRSDAPVALEPFVKALDATPYLDETSVSAGRVAGTLIVRARMLQPTAEVPLGAAPAVPSGP